MLTVFGRRVRVIEPDRLTLSGCGALYTEVSGFERRFLRHGREITAPLSRNPTFRKKNDVSCNLSSYENLERNAQRSPST